ncbi:MAG: response regulator [Planctomycetes bacterium]|nr:response regulator [Planctomycetota bacterium]
MRQATVFVVDDEEQICSLLQRILARDGLRVLVFASGTAALETMERERPDLVITDLMMPGMSGLDLAGHVRAIHADASVIVMTGYASLENVVDALRGGVDDFITKPFSATEIRTVVQRVLARKTVAAPADPVTEPVAGAQATVALSAPAATPPEARDGHVTPLDPNLALARRLRDMTLLETIHGFLADDLVPSEIAARAADALRDALGAARCAVIATRGRDGPFHLVSVSGGADIRRDETFDLPFLTFVSASGNPAPLEPFALGGLTHHLGDGPAAGASLAGRGGPGSEAALLVVARNLDARAFDGEDLRVLGVAAAALGDLFRSLRAAESAEHAYIASLVDVVTATEHRAPWFLDHSTRVRDLSVRLAVRLGLPDHEICVLEAAAPLLDIGRVHIGDELLAKAGRLSTDEWRTLRSHPEIADAIVRPVGRLSAAKPVIRHHHENWDGSGYPDGLRGDDIPYLASIVRITDAYAALTSARPWRSALGPADAVRRLVDFSGTHFHPQLVAAFAAMQLEGATGGGA